ncbi:MAG: hemolysin III family protein [Halobacteriovoraceae bacterium]|nr:hemolysin III family protein [Halobacteriovoraceae bacterium]
MTEYSKAEEQLNIYTHKFGFLLSIIGLVALIIKGGGDYPIKAQVSFIIFGISLVTLYLASTLYHNAKDPDIRIRRKVLDHSAIYVLIAGTYTPFVLAGLGDKLGWTFFFLSWGFALIGVSLKIFFTGKFKVISTLMYVFMGWMVLFFINPLREVISESAFQWLFYGGVSYTIGALIYLIKKINFNHAIFHLLVLVGSFCHFVSIYYYF